MTREEILLESIRDMLGTLSDRIATLEIKAGLAGEWPEHAYREESRKAMHKALDKHRSMHAERIAGLANPEE